jgi:selenide,water dikinase
MKDENLLVGTEFPDDAAVYRLNENLALIQTVDFFPPVVDDPYYYGQIAAVNALSDVYAMGGRPLTAMNIVCFPCRKLGTEILVEILKGGARKVIEAGALLVGGHTINDDEPKYGLAVTGVVSPDEIFTKGGAEPGDQLILTKPLGSGIITTALKGGIAPEHPLEEMIHWMTTLNKGAAEVARTVGVKTCTDITGFGLLGHIEEMIRGSGVDAVINVHSVPKVEGTLALAEEGVVPGGAKANRDFLRDKLVFAAEMDEVLMDVLCDPQTSGGLLMAVKKERAPEAIRLLKIKRLAHAAVIGEITPGGKGQLVLK